MKPDPKLMADILEAIAWGETCKPMYRTQQDEKVLALLKRVQDKLSEGHTKQYPV